MSGVWKCVVFITAVAGFILTSSKVDYAPVKNFWQARGGWLLWAALVTAIAPSLQLLLSERTERARLQRERAFREILTGVFVGLIEKAEMEWKTTGIQAFLVRRRLHVRHRPFAKVQDKIVRFRLASLPKDSGIPWTRGKGVIGKCWTTETPQFMDLRQVFPSPAPRSQAEWDQLPEDKTLNLEYSEYLRTKDHYGIVGAMPVTNRKGRYIGCVSLDLPVDSRQDPQQRDVFEALAAASAMITIYLTK